MKALEGPFELLDLAAGEMRSMTVVAAEEGEMTIHPSYAPGGKVIHGLRVHVEQEDKPLFPYYWDVTSQTLLAQWAPQVLYAGYRPKRFRVTKVGSGPAARFQLATEPVVKA